MVRKKSKTQRKPKRPQTKKKSKSKTKRRSYGRRSKRKSRESRGGGGYFTGDDYLKCPHCGVKYHNSRDIISIGPRKFFTTASRRIYGCYNCKKILGLGTARNN